MIILPCSEHTMYLFSTNPRAFPSQGFGGKQINNKLWLKERALLLSCAESLAEPQKGKVRGASLGPQTELTFSFWKGEQQQDFCIKLLLCSFVITVFLIND